MTILGLAAALLLTTATAANYAQDFPHEHRPMSNEARLPGGKSQVEALLKEDHKHSIRDAAQLLELAESLKQELEKDDRHVLSVSSLRKTEEIEKLARKIRGRLKRF
jgi:predicted RND superfamily exporter protein